MKSAFIFLTAALLASCVHTSIAPVANENGVPVVIRVPEAKVGQKVPSEKIKAIDKKVEDGLPSAPEQAKPDPGLIGIGTIGIVSDLRTKKGEKFVGYLPTMVVRATYPADVVDRAAGRMAAAYYRSAKKQFQLVPITELAEQSKITKQ